MALAPYCSELYLLARRKDRLLDLARELNKYPCEIKLFAVDLTNQTMLKDFACRIMHRTLISS